MTETSSIQRPVVAVNEGSDNRTKLQALGNYIQLPYENRTLTLDVGKLLAIDPTPGTTRQQLADVSQTIAWVSSIKQQCADAMAVTEAERSAGKGFVFDALLAEREATGQKITDKAMDMAVRRDPGQKTREIEAERAKNLFFRVADLLEDLRDKRRTLKGFLDDERQERAEAR